MPDEVLAEVVTKAMQKAFFEERTVATGGFHGNEVRPAWVVSITKELLNERVKAEVKSWIESNDEKIQELLTEAIRGGVGQVVLDLFNRVTQGPLQQMKYDLELKLGAFSP
jgi:hypothetical protein